MRRGLPELLAALGFLLLAQCAVANTHELTRRHARSFKINGPSYYVEVDNKYGDIKVLPWEKDSVSVEVIITVRSEKHHRLQEMLDEIDVAFDNTPVFLLVETGWETDVSFFKKNAYNFKQGLDADDKIRIDQIIHVPQNLTMEIRNRFGNVYMSDHTGTLDIILAHGDFRGRNLPGLRTLELKFGRLKVKEVTDCRISLNSVNSARIESAKELMLASASSDIEISSVQKVTLDSKHDDISIESIGGLYGDALLSDVQIGMIQKSIDLACKMGSVRIADFGSSARNIRLDGNRTDISIALSKSVEAVFDIDVDNKSQLSYPSGINVEKKGISEEGNEFMTGRLGADPSTTIVIRASGGYVDISDR